MFVQKHLVISDKL